ncbi:MAG: hypothetical protein HZB54_04055 [Deltaproteobacteria bacterium]|nr:hypothetical protein [Deltaproteobacteria bacterium]
MLCRNCGTNFPDNIANCPKCSAALPRPIKVFKPESDKPSSRIRAAILLALLLSVIGIAVFKLYFISRPGLETSLDAAKQVTAPKLDREDSALNITEPVKKRHTSETMTRPQAVQDSHKDLLIKDSAENKTSYQRTREGLEEQVEKGFQKKEGSHFIVKFGDAENSDIGHLISIVLEEAYIKVGSDIGYYPNDRIEAVLYTQQQFTDVTRAPGWVGAIYDGRIKIPVGGITSRTSLLEKVLFHEYTHALVHRLSNGRAPLWLNEGLAQHEEGAVNEGINNVLTQVAKIEKPLPLRPFEGSFMGFNATQAIVAYSVSLSATEYIIKEFGMSAVKRILENIGTGKTIEEAVSSSLYISYEDLQSNWFMSLKRKFAG